jgi:hypothetical protein
MRTMGGMKGWRIACGALAMLYGRIPPVRQRVPGDYSDTLVVDHHPFEPQ